MAQLSWFLMALSVLFTHGTTTSSGSPNAQVELSRTPTTRESSNVTAIDDIDTTIYQNRTLESPFNKEEEETPSTAELRVDQSPVLHLQENWIQGPIQLEGHQIDYDPFLHRTIFNLAALKPLLGIPIGPVPRPATVNPVVTPGLTPSPRHGCSFAFSPCRYDESYPRDKVNLIVDRFYNDVNHMYNDLYHLTPQNLVFYDNRTHGYRSGGHFVCESRMEYMRPGWARTVQGRLLAVLNTDKFPQIIRVERCQYEGRRCEYLPPCYKSSCVQRNSYVKLIGIDPDYPSQKPTVEVFEVPTACSCFVEDFTYF